MKNLFAEAKFDQKKDENGPYAMFDKKYIEEVRNYCNTHEGKLHVFLGTKLKSYGNSINREGKMYFNSYSVAFVLEQIKYFKKNNKWETVK